MAEADSETQQQMDFITFLPPEIVVHILVNLSLADILSCVRVCSNWYHKIMHLDTYWKKSLKLLGVCEYVVSRCRHRYPEYRDIALKVYKTHQYIRSSRPEIKLVSRYYSAKYYFQCNYFRYGVLVGTLYEDFIPLSTAVYTVRSGVLQRTHEFTPIVQATPHRVVWSYVYCDYLLLASANGIWKGHNLISDKVALTWQGPTLYDADILIGCCRDCFLVATGKTVFDRISREGFWDLQMLQLGRGHETPTITKVKLNVTSLQSHHLTANCCKCIRLISKDFTSIINSFCTSHWLLLQWSDQVHVYEVNSDGKLTSFSLSQVLSPEIKHLEINSYHSTVFSISSDQSIMGYIVNGQLSVWSLSSMKIVSQFLLPHRTERVQINLLSLGHLYTVMGYESVYGAIQVVSTYTGQHMFGAHGFIDRATSSIGTPPPYFIFLGLVDEEWLNRIDILPHPTLPLFLYWDKMDHCVYGIVLQQKVKTNHSAPVQSANKRFMLKNVFRIKK